VKPPAEGDPPGFRLEISRERVTLPGGQEAQLDIVRHPGASAIVPFLDDGRVVLIRQYRHAAGGYILEVPAGKLDPGDTPESCAARELEEEAGQRAGRLEKLGWIFTTPGFTDEVIHLFAAYELEAVGTRHEKDEVIELVPTPFEEALELVWRGELHDAKSAMALLHAAHRHGLRP
jgi:ADP-ribose pyrophosphatase